MHVMSCVVHVMSCAVSCDVMWICCPIILWTDDSFSSDEECSICDNDEDDSILATEDQYESLVCVLKNTKFCNSFKNYNTKYLVNSLT